MRTATPRLARESAAVIIAPPRGRPSEIAGANLRNHRGALDIAMSPMMIEPLDQLGGREYQGIVLVGPQRSSKTFALILGGLTYVILSDPGDVLVTSITMDKAREFSFTELGTAIRYSPALQDKMSPRASDDNAFDKWFRSGMVLKVGWPAISQLSSSTYRYVFLTDYDRPANRDNVDGEGPLWDAAFRRTLTFMSRGKCLAESSPGEDVTDPTWKPQDDAPHEAPPALGILSLYNNGTRARWYWPCLHCNAFFQAKPGWDAFAMPNFDELRKVVGTGDIEALVEEYARVACPHCGAIHDQTQKMALTAGGIWVHEGQRIEEGKVVGDRRRTNIWSGWLGGVAASYQRWDAMVRNYLQAVRSYTKTGDESGMRIASTSDAAAPYLPVSVRNKRDKEALLERLEQLPKAQVPDGVRFLTAAVDVQSRRFVVQVHGWGVGLQQWIIDRYEITGSRRKEFDAFAGIEPAAYVEDWDALLMVIAKSYPIMSSKTGRTMTPLLTFADSGGADGVTENAFRFWRSAARRGFGKRIQLVKGDGRITAPRVQRSWPDTRERAGRGASRGDVPVWFLNTNLLKDGIASDLSRAEMGPGYLHLPSWLTQEDRDIFDELISEIRTPKGWENPGRRRNEALDLAVYNRGALIALSGEHIDWDHPPTWAAERTDDPIDDTPKKPRDPVPHDGKSLRGLTKGGWAKNW